MKTYIPIIFIILLILLMFTTELLSQPPGLPSTPDQAPIDGGLGLLAAAGGVYAWKKFRDKKEA